MEDVLQQHNQFPSKTEGPSSFENPSGRQTQMKSMDINFKKLTKIDKNKNYLRVSGHNEVIISNTMSLGDSFNFLQNSQVHQDLYQNTLVFCN